MKISILPFLVLLSGCAVAVTPLNDWTQPPTQESYKSYYEALETAPTQEELARFSQDKWCPSGVGFVRVVNDKPVVATDAKAKAWRRLAGKSQTFTYGSSCLSETNGWWQSLGSSGDAGTSRVLVNYWSPLQRDHYLSCVSGVVFFMDAEAFKKHCEVSAPEPPPVASDAPAPVAPNPAEPTTATPRQLIEQEREKQTVRELLGQHGK